MRRNNKITFKKYDQEQLMLPMSLDLMIPANHKVRIINDAIDKMDIQALLDKYKPGGTSSYHPKMMLKVLIYAYSEKIYTSRKIAKHLNENINFMWISGMNKPDFRTINSFRSVRMKDVIEEVFTRVLELLIEEGYVKLENYFVDGTKIEANANRYSFVWKKSISKNKAKLQEKVKGLLEEIDRLNDEEDNEYGNNDLEELGKTPIDSEKLDKLAKEINEKLSKNPKDKKLRKISNKINKDFLPRLKKYEEQEKIFGENRNSYSKTDHDATFMRMKEDHMRNGQLKPGYNIQIGTENQFIVGYSIHQNRNDNGCLIPHLEKLKSNIGKTPYNVISDSGYGNEENYEYLVKNSIVNYVKYPYFHKEQKKSFKKQIFRVENLLYDKETDEYICPAVKRLKYIYTKTSKTETGYQQEQKIYECEDCNGCIFKSDCTKAQYNRQISINTKLNEYKSQAKENLLSATGKELRSKRPIEVESVFGQIKWNDNFKRFLLRGMEKVNIEWGLISIAHNFSKMFNMKTKKAKEIAKLFTIPQNLNNLSLCIDF